MGSARVNRMGPDAPTNRSLAIFASTCEMANRVWVLDSEIRLRGKAQQPQLGAIDRFPRQIALASFVYRTV
ncbi:MAG: hypothetical protein JWO36_2101 [Myxococcales bacterium]|nr:hypothetical protein [Myxococcales bacterium]